MGQEASARKKATPRRSGRKGRRARWILGLGVPLAVVATIVLIVVYVQITATFEGRVWTLPSRVYAAGRHVATGMAIDGETLAARLQRTGYEKIDAMPARPGQYRVHGRSLDLYVRAFAGGD